MISAADRRRAKNCLRCGIPLLAVAAAFWALHTLAPAFKDGYFTASMFGSMGLCFTVWGGACLLLPAKKISLTTPVKVTEEILPLEPTSQFQDLREISLEAPEKVTF